MAIGTPVAVGNAGSTSGVPTSTLVILTPVAGVAVGSLLIVFAACNTSGSITVADVSGNTYQRDKTQDGSGPNVAIFSCVVTSALVSTNAITITFPASEDRLGAAIFKCSGTWATTSIDKTAGNNGSSSGGAYATGTTLTTSTAAELIAGMLALNLGIANIGDVAWDAGPTQNPLSIWGSGNSLGPGCISGWKIVASTGTQAFSGTGDEDITYTGAIATYKEVAAGTKFRRTLTPRVGSRG